MARQYQTPQGDYINETATRQYMTADGYVNETVAAAATFNAAWNIAANTVIQPGALTA